MLPTWKPSVKVSGAANLQRPVKPKKGPPGASKGRRSRSPWKKMRRGARALATRGAFLRASSAVAVAPDGKLVAVRPEIEKFTPHARWAREADDKIREGRAHLLVKCNAARRRGEDAQRLRDERGLAPHTWLAALLGLPRDAAGFPRPWSIDGDTWLDRMDDAIEEATILPGEYVTGYPGLDGARAAFSVVTHGTDAAKTTHGVAPVFVAQTTLAPNNATRARRKTRIATMTTNRIADPVRSWSDPSPFYTVRARGGTVTPACPGILALRAAMRATPPRAGLPVLF